VYLSSNFLYELDAAASTFGDLAVLYGTTRGAVRALNPGVRARAGTNRAGAGRRVSVGGSRVLGGTARPASWCGTQRPRGHPLGARSPTPTSSAASPAAAISARSSRPSGRLLQRHGGPRPAHRRADGIVAELRYLGLTDAPECSSRLYPRGETSSAPIRSEPGQEALAVAVAELGRGVSGRPPAAIAAPRSTSTRVSARPGHIGGSVVSGTCGRAWCAYFVRWCLNQVGVSNRSAGRRAA